jgi:hypothetical protein
LREYTRLLILTHWLPSLSSGTNVMAIAYGVEAGFYFYTR